jgi:hypothetical protein
MAVRKKPPAPQPSYQSAQRARVTIGMTPVTGPTNAFTELVLKRVGKARTVSCVIPPDVLQQFR